MWLCGLVVVSLCVIITYMLVVRCLAVTLSEYNTFYVLTLCFTVKVTTFERVRITIPKSVVVTMEMTFLTVKVTSYLDYLKAVSMNCVYVSQYDPIY